MKATLEFPAPESCLYCPIESHIGTDHCGYTKKSTKGYIYSRHPECPLQIELSDEEQIKLAVKAHEELNK